MNACPTDTVLLRFLDGEFDAEDDARVLARVEDWIVFQDNLERLTNGRSAAGDGLPNESLRTEPEETPDLPGTEVDTLDECAHESLGGGSHCAPSDLGEPGSSADDARGQESSEPFASVTDSTERGKTEEPDAGEDAHIVVRRQRLRPTGQRHRSSKQLLVESPL
jgi:hypothetical protein